MFRGYCSFIREFFRKTYSTGAILPSGPYLCRKIARFIDYSQQPAFLKTNEESDPANNVISEEKGHYFLEVGPGTGCVTREIVKRMGPNDHLDLIECNENFVERLKKMLEGDPVMKTAANRIRIFSCYVQDFPVERKYDRIISGLPLNNFPVELVKEILDHFERLAAPNAVVSWFEYIAIRRIKSVISKRSERVRLRGITGCLNDVLKPYEIRRDAVLVNVPPAWIHHIAFNKSIARDC